MGWCEGRGDSNFESKLKLARKMTRLLNPSGAAEVEETRQLINKQFSFVFNDDEINELIQESRLDD